MQEFPKQFIIHSEQEMYSFGSNFVCSVLYPTPYTLHLSVVALHGELGAGKTTFVKGVADALGVKSNVNSPTFVIIKKYPIRIVSPRVPKASNGTSLMNNTPWENLVHIDAYRLESADEIFNLGWREIVDNPKNLIMIEWAENITAALPKTFFIIKFVIGADNERIINIMPVHKQYRHL